MAIMRFIVGRNLTRRTAPHVPPRAKSRVQAPDTPELRALEGVTYIPAHDAKGRMDDDLFDLLCQDSASAR